MTRFDEQHGQMRLSVGVGPRCPGCPLLAICPAASTDYACPERRTYRGQGGLNTWDLRHPDAQELMRQVGGPGFEAVTIAPTELPAAMPFVAQLRVRTALRGQLARHAYVIGAQEAIGKRKRVLTADRLRELVGIPETVDVYLQLFGADAVLDRLWRERDSLVPQIANAGYARTMGPSYSMWMPRPPPEHLINHKRSQIITRALQDLQTSVVPRVAFAFPGDVRRYARWLQANPATEAAALDLGTYRSARGWREQLEFLAEFDDLTERRLRYWIHGPSTLARLVALFSVIEPTRVTTTNARAIAFPSQFRSREEEARRTVSLAVELANLARAKREANEVGPELERDLAPGIDV